MKRLLLFFVGCWLLLVPRMATAQAQGGVQVKFGKNRVQYHRDFAEWSQYESDNFFVYWYGKSRTSGQKVVQMAEYDFDDIQTLLEHRLNDKLQIIVYADVTDVKQSNIGSEDLFTSASGETKVSGTTIFVYYHGDYRDLRRQVREGIAAVYLNTMLYGSNIQEIVQNAVMLNLPDWFKMGLVAYAGETWGTEQDNALRSIFLSGKYKRFERFAEANPRLAGHAVWYFISEQFGGRTKVSNLLYLTRINRSIESGFLYVLDKSYETVIQEWEAYFRRRYANEATTRVLPVAETATFRKRDQLPLTQLKLSPQGRQVAYVVNEIGRATVFLYDLQTKKKRKIFRTGYRNALQATDYGYPLLAWNPNGQQLSLLYEFRDNLKLLHYDLRKKKWTAELLSEQYQRVFSMDYLDPFSLVFSAAVSGQTDLYTYFPRTRQSQRLTNDVYDDLDATVVNVRNRRGILFTSNRPDAVLRNTRADTILPVGTFDVFYLDLQKGTKELVQVTQTPLANERQPLAVDTTYFAYLSDRAGIYNREIGRLEDYIDHYERKIFLTDGSEMVLHADSLLPTGLDTTQIDSVVLLPVVKARAITHNQTNWAFNAWYQHSAPQLGRSVVFFKKPGARQFFFPKIDPAEAVVPQETSFFQTQQQTRSRLVWRDTSRQFRAPAVFLPPLPPTPTPTVELPAPVANSVTPIDTLPVATVLPLGQDTLVQATDTLSKTLPDIPLGFLFQSEFEEPEVKKSLQKTLQATAIRPSTAPIVTTPSATPTPTTPAVRSADTLLRPSNPGTLRQRLPLVLPGVNRPLYLLNPARVTPYRVQYRTDYMNTEINNNLLFDGLQDIAANPDGFQFPQPGILFKTNVKDLFEDYEFEGGMRVPTTFNGAEYYATFQNKKNRLDQTYALYMRNFRINQETNTISPRRQESNILLAQYGLKYPLDVFRSFRGTFTLRRDQLAQLITDANAYRTPTLNQPRIGFRLEYVFDNTVDLNLNLRNGTRYRLMAETVKRFDVRNNDGLDLQFNEGLMTILGLDFRHYQRILRHSVWATRLAGNTSFGSERMLYFLGGVDNWLFPENNNNISVPQGNFAFQTLAANLRGFPINIRNGNSFVLVNTELRVPVFQYISRRIQSSLLKNFQVVGFFDVGTAWEGRTPFREDNPLNTSVFRDGEVITVTVNYYRDPIVAGYGFGARTTLFGYFIRADYAWGIETRQVQKPKLFVALGLDF